jgi:hypothetical protein
MRRGRCPKCEGTEIGHVPQLITQLDGDLQVVSLVPSTEILSAADADLEAYVCLGCGFLETYARQPQRLAAIPGLQRLSGPPSGGVHR